MHPVRGMAARDYFEWRKARFCASWRRLGPVLVPGQCVLDVGIGYGATTASLAEWGARVVAGDVRADRTLQAREFCLGLALCLVRFRGEALPFPDGVFDGAVLFDVLEHVADPGLAVREIARVVRPEGWIFVEFTPYYSLAGHHLYDYTFLPLQFLPRNWARRYLRRVAARCGVDSVSLIGGFEALNRLSIRAFCQMTRLLGLTVLDELRVLRTFWFEIGVGFLRLAGPLQELFTTSYTCLLKK